ncbi:MAG: SDR family oxidoreductase, partial [Deltaproteobacteria bacterium]
GGAVLVCDANGEGADAVAASIRDGGGKAEAMEMDVTRQADVESAVERCVALFGSLDAAVNNAGITGRAAPLADTDAGEWQRVLGVNLTGTFLCLKYELAQMRKQGRGVVVNVASGSGIVGTPGLVAYCASKHGILGLTKTAAIEHAGSGIRVNAVCPGSTDTPMLRAAMRQNPQMEALILASQPGGRLGRPEEIAEAIVWLCSERSSFVSGATLLVDGGAVAR